MRLRHYSHQVNLKIWELGSMDALQVRTRCDGHLSDVKEWQS